MVGSGNTRSSNLNQKSNAEEGRGHGTDISTPYDQLDLRL